MHEWEICDVDVLSTIIIELKMNIRIVYEERNKWTQNHRIWKNKFNEDEDEEEWNAQQSKVY